MVSAFKKKVENCHIIYFDFKQHQLMVLDYLHGMNEIRTLEYKCRSKQNEMGFYKILTLQQNHNRKHNRNQNQNQNHNHHNMNGPPIKKQKVNERQEINGKDIEYKVKTILTKQLGFIQFGESHQTTFGEKLRTQIYTKQLIREQVTEINLKSSFAVIDTITEWMQNKRKMMPQTQT